LIISSVFDSAEREKLIAAAGQDIKAGRRDLLASPAVSALAYSERVLNLVRPHFEREPFPVRAIYFDKSPETNWLVPWHQDLTLAVRDRIESPGFGPWSTKEGIPHVQPPPEILEQMLTVRLHLDDADQSNGALRVLLGSHRFGRLSRQSIEKLQTTHAEYLCAVPAGGAMVMRPLLLHASSRSVSSLRRRVLHLEYAFFGLPFGLHWHVKRRH
jgi:hypothetical protein